MSTKDRSHCFLSIETGKQQGQEYTLPQTVVKIGRAASSDLLLSDPTVSLQHACIVPVGEGAYGIEDIRSVNGVALNEHMLAVGVIEPLQDGDRIQLGEVVLIFHQQ